jgi:hypothetical protein
VSYIQLDEDGALPDAPAKLSLNTVLHPEGGAGTVVALAAVGKAAKTASSPTATSAAFRRPCLMNERACPGTRGLAKTDVICSSQVHRPPRQATGDGHAE